MKFPRSLGLVSWLTSSLSLARLFFFVMPLMMHRFTTAYAISYSAISTDANRNRIAGQPFEWKHILNRRSNQTDAHWVHAKNCPGCQRHCKYSHEFCPVQKHALSTLPSAIRAHRTESTISIPISDHYFYYSHIIITVIIYPQSFSE